MATIELKGREIPLLFTVWEMKAVQEEIGPLSRVISLTLGRNPEDEDDTSGYGGAEHLGTVAKMIRIMGNAGLEETDQPADLTEKKILRALRPIELAEIVGKCMDAMNEGLQSEIPQKEKTGPVDVVLEEIEKKKETAG